MPDAWPFRFADPSSQTMVRVFGSINDLRRDDRNERALAIGKEKEKVEQPLPGDPSELCRLRYWEKENHGEI